jgi:hypothetical protein
MLRIVAVVSSLFSIEVFALLPDVTSCRFCWLTACADFRATRPIDWLKSFSDVVVPPLVRDAGQRRRIDLRDAQLQLQQREQITRRAGLVRLLHQRGLARALGRIGFAIRMQFARDVAKHLADCAARTLRDPLAHRLQRRGLRALPACLPPPRGLLRLLCRGRLDLLRNGLSQFFLRHRGLPGVEFDAKHLARHRPRKIEVRLLLVREAHLDVRVVPPQQRGILALGQQFRQLPEKDVAHLGTVRLAVRPVSHRPVEQLDHRDAPLAQAIVQRRNLRNEALLIDRHEVAPFLQQSAPRSDSVDQLVEELLRLAERGFAARHTERRQRGAAIRIVEKGGLFHRRAISVARCPHPIIKHRGNRDEILPDLASQGARQHRERIGKASCRFRRRQWHLEVAHAGIRIPFDPGCSACRLAASRCYGSPGHRLSEQVVRSADRDRRYGAGRPS